MTQQPAIAIISTLTRFRLKRALGMRSVSKMMAASLLLIGASAQATPPPSYDLASVLPRSNLSPLLARLVFSNDHAVEADPDLEQGSGLFDRAPASEQSELTRFDEMVGHHIRWHYDEDWSSSFGSDFPKIRTPGYVVGNGAPGVTQKIWFQFVLSRSF